MTNDIDDDLRIAFELERVFLPYAFKIRENVRENGGRFSHYTSAENATNIVRSASIWMRNARCMNDYSEILHGHQQLVRIFNEGDYKERFCNSLDAVHPKLGSDSLSLFDQWWSNLHLNTYICSISEHDASEDEHGRLSMWRAYGRVSGKAALIFKLPLHPGAAKALNLLVSPVAYFPFEEIQKEFNKVVDSINDNVSFLKSVPVEQVKSMAFYMLVMSSVCLKHEGFKEEREWRVIYLPYVRPSDYIKKSIEIIDGIPQPIYKIPLINNPEANLSGLSIADMVERIIIGPSVFPAPMVEAFATTLLEAGASSDSTKVVVSNIPLRT
jgi:hypothetical protein